MSTPGTHPSPPNPRNQSGPTSINTTRDGQQVTSSSLLASKGNTTRAQADQQLPPSHQPGVTTPNSGGTVKR